MGIGRTGDLGTDLGGDRLRGYGGGWQRWRLSSGDGPIGQRMWMRE
jgi:hypothetical protein